MSNALDTHDSFDTYSSTQIATEGWTNGAISTTSGRRGGGALNGSNGQASRTLRTNYQTILWSFAYFVTSVPSANNPIVNFTDAGTTQFDLRTNSSVGGLKFTRNGTLVGTATADGILTANVWHFIEFRVTFGTGTAGTAEVKVDGTSAILASGVNTSNTGNATANGINIVNVGGGLLIDDMYVYGGNSGSVPAYIGDVAVKAFAPTADGFHLDFTPNSGTPHWSRTSEIPPDEDTSYNSSNTPGAIDGATFATVGAGTVYGVQHRVRARYDDAGPHTLASVVRIASTDYTSAAVALSNTYQTFAFIWETSPATGIAWTVSELNGAEWDSKLVT